VVSACRNAWRSSEGLAGTTGWAGIWLTACS
jgi:hypothetical protein